MIHIKSSKKIFIILIIILLTSILQKGLPIYKSNLNYYSNQGFVGDQSTEWRTWESVTHRAYFDYSDEIGWSLNISYEPQHSKIPSIFDSYWSTIDENDSNSDYNKFLYRLSMYDFLLNLFIILIIFSICMLLIKPLIWSKLIEISAVISLIINLFILTSFGLLFPKWGTYSFYGERDVYSQCIETWKPGISWYLLIISCVLLTYIIIELIKEKKKIKLEKLESTVTIKSEPIDN